MKILTYDEALNKADNPTWFKSFYKRDEICSDDEVKLINDRIKKYKINPLLEYIKIREDFMLQKDYFEDVIAYLDEIEE